MSFGDRSPEDDLKRDDIDYFNIIKQKISKIWDLMTDNFVEEAWQGVLNLDAILEPSISDSSKMMSIENAYTAAQQSIGYVALVSQLDLEHESGDRGRKDQIELNVKQVASRIYLKNLIRVLSEQGGLHKTDTRLGWQTIKNEKEEERIPLIKPYTPVKRDRGEDQIGPASTGEAALASTTTSPPPE